MNRIKVALVGNPNVGKTALINNLAGLKLKVGNWSGVTVEKKCTDIEYDNSLINIVDLPGVYSLRDVGDDAKVTKDFLHKEEVDVFVCVVNSNNLERNLLLVSEILDIGKPVLIVFNFWKEFTSSSNKLDFEKLKKDFGIAGVGLDVNKKHNKEVVLEKVLELAGSGNNYNLKFVDPVERKIQKKIESGAKNRLVAVESLEPEFEEGFFIKERQKSILKLVTKVVSTVGKKKKTITEKLDQILLNKFLGVPIFLAILYLVFKITFDGSGPFIDWIDGFVAGFVSGQVGTLLQSLNTPEWLQSFLIDGVIGGVGIVLTFVPLLFFLYVLLAILEESGYMARAATVMDRVLRPFGLQGKSFVPLVVGFGCNVPAVLATRGLSSLRDRQVAASLISFFSCGAKLPIYVLFTAVFFADNQASIIILMYLVGILVAIIWSLVLNKFVYKKPASGILIELPNFRFPTLRVVLLSGISKVKSFIKNAGTTITLVVIAVWAMVSLPYGVDAEDSILARSANVISPIFKPLGFGDSWQAVASVIPGFLAKESVVGALGTTYALGEEEEGGEDVGFGEGLKEQGVALGDAVIGSISDVFAGVIPGVFAVENEEGEPPLYSKIREDMSSLSALSYMIFNLLLVSCAAVMGVVRQEFGVKFLLRVLLMTTATAYVTAMLVYNLGLFLGF